MKKPSSFLLLLRMGMREVRRSWAQFLAIFLIGAIAVTLFVGLLSNAATFEYQTERAYDSGNCADIFLTSARHEEEEEEAIRTILGDKGELDGRYEFFGTANGKNAYLAVHDGMPRIGKPYSLSTGEIHTEDYYCLVDESLILGRVDTGLYEVGNPLLFEVPLSAYLGQLSDIQLDWAAIGEEAEAVLEENPRLALILQLMGLDLDEILASLESLIGSEVDLEEALSFLDSYVKEGGTNLLREDSLILPLVVTGSMKHPENIQLSSYQMTTILASDRMLKEAFQSVLEQNYQGIGLELARFGAAILLGWDSASLLPDSASPLALPNQYLITVEDDTDIPELKRELHEYFKDDLNVLSISERAEMPFAITMENDLLQARQFTFVFPFVFFAVAILIVLTTTGQMVLKGRTEIGTMKAIGLSRKAVYGYYLGIVLSLVFLGTLLGEILGPLIVPAILGVKYDLLYSLPARIVVFPWWEGILTALAFLLLAGLATWLMARREVRPLPSVSMRPRSPRAHSLFRAGLIPPKGKAGPFLLSLRMAFRNIRVEWVRSLMLFVGVAGCTMLLVTGYGIENSVDYGVEHDLSAFYDADYSAVLASGTKEEALLSAFSGEDWAKDVEPYLSTTGPVSLPDSPSVEMDVRVLSREDSHVELPLAENALFLSEKSARELGAAPGDILSFQVEGVLYEAPLTGIYESFVFHGIMVLKDHPVFEGREFSYGNFWLDVEGERGAEEMEELVSGALEEAGAPALMALTGRAEYRAIIEDIMSSVDVMTGAVKVFASLLAIVSLYNLALLSFRERARDIATLRVLGFNRVEIASLLLSESLSITALGVALGMGLGYPFLLAVMNANKVAIVEYMYWISPWTYVIAFLLTFLLAFLVNLFFALRANKVDMISSLKSVE